MKAEMVILGKEECVQETHQGFLARSIPARRRRSLHSRLRTSQKKDTQLRVLLLGGAQSAVQTAAPAGGN